MLDRMTKAMGRRLPVTVVEGNLRPHDPLQAAKFASEAGVVMREEHTCPTTLEGLQER